MKYKAILFDLDGTLLDTIDDLAESMNSVLLRLGFPVHDISLYKIFVGEGIEHLVRCSLPKNQQHQETVHLGMRLMREEYEKRWNHKTKPYPEITELLDELHSQNLRMAVLSNKPDDLTKLMIARFLPSWHFEAVMGSLPTNPRKPDPSMALQIAQTMNILPGNFIYLGDTSIDMRTACASGMFAVGALWGFRGADELLSSGAKVLIHTPLELLNLL